MINVRVFFGNKNTYNVQIHNNTLCGDLIYILPMGIGKTYRDVLYLILNGKLLDTCDLDKPVFDAIDNECITHIIFKYDTLGIQDKFICARYEDWVKKKKLQNVITNNTLSLFNNLRNLNMEISFEPDQLIDVPVIINEDELGFYIERVERVERMEEDEQDEPAMCAICSATMLLIDNQSRVKKCGHHFHTSCISNWLTGSNVKCPMCNIDVRLEA
jgi:hypothetical protein